MPIRVERSLGPAGKPLARVGLKAAGTPWIARNAGFRALRAAALKTIGGATYFTPEQVTSVMEACLRRIVARENLAVVMRSPRTPYASDGTPRSMRRAEARRQFVHQHHADLCRRLHVEYIGFDNMVAAQHEQQSFLGDLVHINAAEHEALGHREGLAMVEAWRMLHPAP